MKGCGRGGGGVRTKLYCNYSFDLIATKKGHLETEGPVIEKNTSNTILEE